MTVLLIAALLAAVAGTGVLGRWVVQHDPRGRQSLCPGHVRDAFDPSLTQQFPGSH